MSISGILCGNQGHKIESFRTAEKPVNIPGIGIQVLPLYTVMCSACGLSLDEIKELENKPAKRVRKPKQPQLPPTE